MMQRVQEIAVLSGLLTVFGLSAPAHTQQPLVDKMILADTIQPVTEGELNRAIAAPTPTAQASC